MKTLPEAAPAPAGIRARLALGLASAMALLPGAIGASEAGAATVTLRGHTSQGFPMSARLVDGRLDRLHFRWRARCGHDTVYRAFTTWFDGDDHAIEQDGKTFSDSGTVRNRKPNRLTIVRRERIAGSFDGTRAITGTHRTTVRIRKRGRLRLTCRSSIRFTAER
jgi:hypothetical protein